VFASFSPGLLSSTIKALAFFVPGSIVRNPAFFMYTTTVEHCAYNAEAGVPITTNFDACVDTVEYKIKVRENTPRRNDWHLSCYCRYSE
jgi:hypothetical protein